jgi:hypothetical protein
MDSDGNRVKATGSFDPVYCGRVARIAAIACVALTLCTAVLLATLQSSKCPGWMIPNGDGTFAPPLWMMLIISGIAALVAAYYAVTWKRFAKRIADQIQHGQATFVRGTEPTWYGNWPQFNAMCATQLDFNSLFVGVMVFWTLFVAGPLILMAVKCY